MCKIAFGNKQSFLPNEGGPFQKKQGGATFFQPLEVRSRLKEFVPCVCEQIKRENFLGVLNSKLLLRGWLNKSRKFPATGEVK
jgi:hypothetical protein